MHEALPQLASKIKPYARNKLNRKQLTPSMLMKLMPRANAAVTY